MDKSKSPVKRSLTVNDTKVRARVERLAELERRGVSQMAALLLKDQLDVAEAQHGLPPLTCSQ